MDYWTECVEEALVEAKVHATKAQAALIAKDVRDAHEMHHEATGQGVASENLQASHAAHLERVEKQLQTEIAKVTCPTCRGDTTIDGFKCWKCNGAGRVS